MKRSLDQIVSLGLDPYLILESELESCFSDQSLNREIFNISCLASFDDHCGLFNQPFYNFSILDNSIPADGCEETKPIIDPFSFCYFPSDGFFLAHSGWNDERITKLLSMSVYSRYEVGGRGSDDSVELISLYGQSLMSGTNKARIDEDILKGSAFRMVFETEYGIKFSWRLRLPMVNESGEFRFNPEMISIPPVFWGNHAQFIRDFDRYRSGVDANIQTLSLPRFSDGYEKVKDLYLRYGLKPGVPLKNEFQPGIESYTPMPTVFALVDSCKSIIFYCYESRNRIRSFKCGLVSCSLSISSN